MHLWRDLNNGTYQVGLSVTFIVSKLVLREIFAADFCRYRKKRRYVYGRSIFDLPEGQRRYIKPCWRKE
ncbi:MAG: hypothetical protein ACI4QM_00225 [Alphaproteobacteria bacterium]